jgi:hypothetical protein
VAPGPLAPAPALHVPHLASPDAWDSIPLHELSCCSSGQPPARATRLALARDASRLYVAFACDGLPHTCTLRHRDAPVWTEEAAEAFLDPWGDLQAYYEINLNPLGTLCDLILRRTRAGWLKDFAWDCGGIATEAALTPTGWRARLAIPFESLAVAPPPPRTRRRANFFRIHRPPGAPPELSAWSPTGRPKFHVQNRFGTLLF